jgi:hypothetical protein
MIIHGINHGDGTQGLVGIIGAITKLVGIDLGVITTGDGMQVLDGMPVLAMDTHGILGDGITIFGAPLTTEIIITEETTTLTIMEEEEIPKIDIRLQVEVIYQETLRPQ